MVSISDYLQDLNDRTYLPGLQREFVWDQYQIENLFDSLIRDYPINLITRWDAARSAEDFHAYEFLTRYIDDDGIAPDGLKEEGYRRYNREVDKDNPDYLVIDGQQRLTSLYIGLFGRRVVYSGGRGGKRSNLGDWTSYELCVNLFGHPDYEGNKLVGDYEFKFRKTNEFEEDDNDGTGHYETELEDGGIAERYWYPLPDLMDQDIKTVIPDSEFNEKTDEFIDDLGLSSEKRDVLKNVKRSVFTDFKSHVLHPDIPTKTVKKESEHIKEIFQRINVEGVKPAPYQLLLSKIMSIWPFHEGKGEDDLSFNPREIIEDWIENFKEDYEEYETSVDRELFLRYSCYLINEMMKTKDVKALSERDILDMRYEWHYSPDGVTVYEDFEWFRSSLQDSFDSITSVGFTEDTMGTMSMVGTIGKFYYRNPDAEPTDPDNLNAIYRFLAQLNLLSHSKGSIGRVEARRVSEFLHEYDEGEFSTFPTDKAFDHLDVEIALETVEKVIDDTRYPSGISESAVFPSGDVAAILGLASGIYTNGDISDYEIDHIFPASREDEIADAANGAEISSIHRLGNLQLLPSEENQEKSDQMPADWLADMKSAEESRYSRYNSYQNLSLDPVDYQAFIQERERRLAEKVMEELS